MVRGGAHDATPKAVLWSLHPTRLREPVHKESPMRQSLVITRIASVLIVTTILTWAWVPHGCHVHHCTIVAL
jgi:hypothetical protein